MYRDAELQKTNWAGQAEGKHIVFSLKRHGVTYIFNVLDMGWSGHGPFGLVVAPPVP